MKSFLANILLIATAGISRAADFYASPAGGGDCSLASPCAISSALPQMKGGDTLNLMDGTYSTYYANYAQLAIINMDKYFRFQNPQPTSAAPVVVKAYPGSHPVIQGDDTNVCVFVDGVTNVIFQDLTISHCWCAGIMISYDMPTSSITVRNNSFSDIVCNDNMGGVYIGAAHDVDVDSNSFTRTYYQGTLSSLSTPSCLGRALVLFNGQDITIRNNNFDNTCTGIYYKHGEATIGAGGYTHIINNTFRNLGSADGIATNQNRSLIANNLLIGANITTHNEDGTVGPFTFDVVIASNTLINGAIGLGGGSAYPGTMRPTIKNNILFNTKYDIWQYGSDTQYNAGIGLTSSANCFYKPGGSQIIDFFGSPNPIYGGANTGGYYSLAQWQAQGYDLKSIETDPRFVNASGTLSAITDFQLQSGSLCQGMGWTASSPLSTAAPPAAPRGLNLR